tara:strand:- start:86 stop:343 length:258 start_codon:yes stop_codon:yes gene_type:complete
MSDLEYNRTIIKTLNSDDLPVYTQWENMRFYRVRNVDGKIIADKLNLQDMEYNQTILDVCLSVDNERCDKDAWRNAMHKFINYLK